MYITLTNCFFIPRHTIVAGYYGITLVIHVSVCPSICFTSIHPYFCFLMTTWVNFQRIFTNHGMFIDIVAIWFGIDNGHISSFFDRVICPQYNNGRILLYPTHMCMLKGYIVFVGSVCPFVCPSFDPSVRPWFRPLTLSITKFYFEVFWLLITQQPLIKNFSYLI